MQKRGYGEDYVHRYHMVTEFYHKRVPLVILIGGTASVGKSTIATHLSQRLNLPNVLHTDLIYDLLRNLGGAPIEKSPLWCRKLGKSETVTEYNRECRVIRKVSMCFRSAFAMQLRNKVESLRELTVLLFVMDRAFMVSS